MNNSLVRRLLRRNVSAVQIAGYAFASLVGLAIVLTAIQFYRDASAVFGGDQGGVMQSDFLVVSKQIGITDRNTAFTPEEIAELEAQPWVNAVGAFTASRFKAVIGLEFAGRGLSSETFFESIPTRYFAHVPDARYYDPAMGE
ncbi:MAG: ABC transporter permease, partial [Muribaculaceae bacterium]|nr:ABC transporter permease [Muribaculaceae bacterium]